MKSFFKYMLATIVGVIISSLLLFFIFFAIISAMVSSAEKEVVINANSVLHLTLDKPIPERSQENPFKNFDFESLRPSLALSLRDILQNIEYAKTDPNIKGIFLDLGIINTGFGPVEEIREALLAFKKTGKFIISYANYYTHKSYYLATVSDSIFINPMGAISFVGLSSEIMFFKGALEKLNIEPQVIRHGKYKSAVEPFTSDKMSPENKQQINAFLGSIWGHLLEGISQQRKIEVDSLNYFADNLSVTGAKAALAHNFIDGIRYKDEILSQLASLSDSKEPEKPELVTIATYNKVKKTKGYESKKIALIVAEGEIVDGSGDEESIGSETFTKAIRDARTDTSVKAIVMRVNSPGGSALASDNIWRELKLAAKIKPLIVSMGSLAASGGYYISTPADTILAEPTTITGSIGVFGVIFNAKGFFNNKLGISTDVAQTNKFGSIGSPFKPLTKEEKAAIQQQIEQIYDTFIGHVSDDRNLRLEYVDSVGQGRVWSALDAKQLGLVDIIGGLEQAIEIAAQKANLKKYRISVYPKIDNSLSAFLSAFSSKIQMNAIEKELGTNAGLILQTKQILENQGVLMQLPYNINVY